MKIELEKFGVRLSRTEMKNVIGGLVGDPEFGCGTDISCDKLKVGDTCGSKGTCVCEKHDGGIWCNTQI